MRKKARLMAHWGQKIGASVHFKELNEV
jgi:hypothetical protein